MCETRTSTAETRRIIRAFNPFHLGDNVYNMWFFFTIRDILERANIHIEYFCQSKYHDQVREFAPPGDVVSIHDYTAGIDYWGDEYGVRLHIGNQRLAKHLFNRPNTNFDEFYVVFFRQFLEMVGLDTPAPAPIKFAYSDYDLLLRYEVLPPQYKDLDILVINSTPCSHQFFLNKAAWDDYIRKLVYLGFKVATTEKTAGVCCTADSGLTLKGIGAVSTRAKVIIAINTGPLSACFNTFTLDNMRRMFVFDRGNTYQHPKVENRRDIHDIHIQELRYLMGSGV